MRAPFNIKQLKRNQSGFTIIEVMIVLAVAALIMLIVFLAVPALQRNARNTSRTADGSKIAAGVNECLSNKNGVVASCNSTASVVGVTLDTATLSQLKTVTVAAGPGAASQASFPSDGSTAAVFFQTACNTAGDAYVTGATVNSNQFAVLFQNEATGGNFVKRCVGN